MHLYPMLPNDAGPGGLGNRDDKWPSRKFLPLLTISSKSTYQVNTPWFRRRVLGAAQTLSLNTTLALSNLLRVLEAKIYRSFS